MSEILNTRRRTVDNKFNSCYKQSIFFNELAVEQYKCLICKNICNKPVELTCSIHEEEDDEFSTTIVGKQCLLKYLSENNNKCPINNHNNCTYGNMSFVSRLLLKQKVKCINFIENKNNNNSNIENSLTPGQVLGNNNYEDSKTSEGEILFGPYSQTDTGNDLEGCNWTGTLKQLNDHVKQCESIKCSFKFNDILFCNEKITNSDLNSHNKIHSCNHIELIRQYIMSQDKKYTKSLTKKDLQIKNLTQEVEKLKSQLDFIQKILSPSPNTPQIINSTENTVDLLTDDIYISEFSSEFKGKKVNISKNNNLNVTGRNQQSIRFKYPLRNGSINKFSLLLNKISESYIIGIVCGDFLTVKDFNYDPYSVKNKKNNNWNKSNVICISSDNDTCINGKWVTKSWNEQLITNDICTFEVNMINKNNRFINIYVNGKLRNVNDGIVISNNNKFENWYPFMSFFDNKDNVTILQGN